MNDMVMDQLKVLDNLVDGKSYRASAWLDVVNPATETTIGQVPDCGESDLDATVAAARAAFTSWKQTPLTARQKLLAVFGNKIVENTEEIARLLTAEQGKPLAEARMEVAGAGYLMQAIAACDIPVKIVEDSDVRRAEVHYVPLGVVGCISPWNFPVMLAYWKVAPALLTGNTVILKPSPFTPLACLRIAELARDIFPAGVFNVITGGDDLGPWLTAHTGIDKISFTGSSATGRKVMASAAATLKRVTLELGGNDSAIVLPDVDLEKAVPDIFWAAFRNSGQICIATKRLYVHESIYDAFLKSFIAYAATIRVGDGSDEASQLGPIQNRAQFKRVLALVEDCRMRGLEFAFEGKIAGANGAGFFVPVMVIDNPPDDSPIVTEEPFGPILPVLRFSSIDDVVARANNTPYGLGNSVWSADTEKAREIGLRLDSGIVWINEVQYLSPATPFGGHKQSGLGVEMGEEGRLEFTNVQTLIVRK